MARLEAKLHPARIRATLGFAGLYQITHELIKHSVLDEVKQFYFSRFFDGTGFVHDEENHEEFRRVKKRYEDEVKSRDPNTFRASLLWLVDGEAIMLAQADRLREIYEHRHDLAHELLKYIVDPEFEADAELFRDALSILVNIRRFWMQVEIDMGTFEHFGEVSVDEPVNLSLVVLRLCIDAYAEGLKDLFEEGTTSS